MASGGSQGQVPPRKRKKRVDRKEAAYARVVETLGEGGREWEQSEGVIYQLLQHGFSEREVRAIVLLEEAEWPG
ncbi:hypothetical protein L915_13963 [Phytophthora nicotianae]|uniref:Uncharacterized protein n=2 Tax=Phytophthora nicotianae TaxID=4792 RepID=W2PW93_PHYN3|nr:hypothetical protein PPTG_14393 [Phytophthora nicotianae INRA-310]ETK80343.1 hypothetical protein L915_13963 [Phytophthora nicotianae]ETN04519.1 hypothetical protein PPTG_14393 [Phytophthora nicotianae INRA-310]